VVLATSQASIRDVIEEAHHSTSSIPVHQNEAAHSSDQFN
jgi:hypothetical protein